MKNPIPPRNPRKQRGVSLLNVVLGLGVFAAASVFTIGMFTNASDTATHQSAVDELAAALTRADSHSAMYGRNAAGGQCPTPAALFGDATNFHGGTGSSTPRLEVDRPAEIFESDME